MKLVALSVRSAIALCELGLQLKLNDLVLQNISENADACIAMSEREALGAFGWAKQVRLKSMPMLGDFARLIHAGKCDVTIFVRSAFCR
jgi:hypothetical protein